MRNYQRMAGLLLSCTLLPGTVGGPNDPEGAIICSRQCSIVKNCNSHATNVEVTSDPGVPVG
eukprot:gene540-3960_t